jgi:hypothetical protein
MADEDFTARSSAMAIITAVGPVRADITRRIEAQKTLLGAGAGATLPPMTTRERQYTLEGGHITSSGTIVGFNGKYGVLVVLEPLYTGATVEWRCKVVPVTAAPRACQ